ncbi:MAG: long-chain acyl-CoA synthetase [Methylophilaceae bacterium]|jgi:long-chain acyl-CoA synthetase
MVNLSGTEQHLCVLPLSSLLENVAGLYATLLAGGTAHIMPSAMVRLTGS